MTECCKLPIHVLLFFCKRLRELLVYPCALKFYEFRHFVNEDCSSNRTHLENYTLLRKAKNDLMSNNL